MHTAGGLKVLLAVWMAVCIRNSIAGSAKVSFIGGLFGWQFYWRAAIF
jgi:hypothetical protein